VEQLVLNVAAQEEFTAPTVGGVARLTHASPEFTSGKDMKPYSFD